MDDPNRPNDLSRRDAFKFLAGSAAGVAAGAALSSPASANATVNAASNTSAASNAALACEVRAAAARLTPSPTPGPDARTTWAHVLSIRSWSKEVYLVLDDGTKGLATTSDAGLAILSACHAADKPVAVCVWGHEPNFAGIGRFAGALVAMDLADLPTTPRV